VTVGIQTFLIVCPLVFVASLVDAVAGGGGLISLPAYMIAGLPVHNAIATNKMSACMGTAMATVQYARKGYIAWKLAPGCVLFALLGSNLGARLALLLPDGYFKLVMLVLLPLTALYVLRGKGFTQEKEPYSTGKTVVLGMIIALVIGTYDGFYGPGTGTFLILFLTALGHMGLTSANGLTKVINLSSNVAALTVFLLNGKVLLLLGGTAALFSIAGGYVGSHFFVKGGEKLVKPVMIAVLAVFFVKVVVELVS
jgi:hypothetical protein